MANTRFSNSRTSSRGQAHSPATKAARTAQSKIGQARGRAAGASSQVRGAARGLLGGAGTALADAGIDLSPIQGAVDELTETLDTIMENVQLQADAAIKKLSSHAAELQDQAQDGDAASRKLYDKAVRSLQQAADMGSQTAKKALAKFGVETD